MKKLSKAQKARNGLKRKPRTQELYFVIGGGINRTKCESEQAAVDHAKLLLADRAERAADLLRQHDYPTGSDMKLRAMGFDPGSKDGDFGAMVEMFKEGPQWHVNRFLRFPKIEQTQCVNNPKPLYIVKVVAVVEQRAAPVVVRKPNKDELAQPGSKLVLESKNELLRKLKINRIK